MTLTMKTGFPRFDKYARDCFQAKFLFLLAQIHKPTSERDKERNKELRIYKI